MGAYKEDPMRLLAVIALACLAACAAPMSKKLNSLSLGMTKAEAIAVMGTPKSTRAADGVEYLTYRLSSSFLDTNGSDTSDYFVKIVSGRVAAYGEKGDFDSTKDPTLSVKADVTTRAQ